MRTIYSGRVSRLVLSFLVAALVAFLGLAPAPAYAEGSFCSDGGVSLAVDYQDLGGGVAQMCDEDGAGKTASQVFEESGVDLTPVGPFPGAACKVDGKPAEATCSKMPPADAYWGLFLAKNGKWGYAPKGADELKLADGAFVAFSWQGSKTATPPSVKPVKGEAGAATASSGSSDAADEQDDDGSVAWWVPVLVLVVLGAAGAVVALRRRSARP